jgi:hypothetical protein
MSKETLHRFVIPLTLIYTGAVFLSTPYPLVFATLIIGLIIFLLGLGLSTSSQAEHRRSKIVDGMSTVFLTFGFVIYFEMNNWYLFFWAVFSFAIGGSVGIHNDRILNKIRKKDSAPDIQIKIS